MTTQSTIDKLIEMRLSAMSDAFLAQLADPKMRDVPFEDRFGMLVGIYQPQEQQLEAAHSERRL